ncbi:hypothetical protein CRU87_08520 [Aliarcobacter trophiarum LMG 25534]|uniref:Membrane protein n=1 Tax=Aliarcobacter trophiarum LMG 25534 TaxID=1032241 RepID=A0AAD0QJK8_9BACT|nr:hypothetical protein [Aliarcobacter trophiarum]AXK49152.1 putative membrane protein [Aliarcobacter trophiarum LMG 25534]RXI26406.1 hypothetical protein CRU89_07010 [Aliarcobacter trophiarum]RXJ89851.1 hypothetical protein CRU87_08520 [Aliarcobacter trophiarum LMG 25534]
MVRNSIDNPVFLIFLLLFSVSINFLASTHFVVILFAGVLSTVFYRTLKQKYYYSFALVVLSFLFIELNMGLKPFSLSLLSYFIYLFIIPRYEQNQISILLNILFFYFVLGIIWYVFFNFESFFSYILIINLMIDLILVGIFL